MSTVDNTSLKNENINKVLIADDSKTEREHLRQLLLSAGYEVTAAESGDAALALVGDAPDLIILDVVMDDGDGYQTCRKLKRNPDTKEIPVIIASSKSNDVDRKWGLKLGASDYFVKPYDDNALLQRISEL